MTAVDRILLLVLATTPPSIALGCSSAGACGPPAEDFELDEEVTADEIDRLVAVSVDIDSWEAVDCEAVCLSHYEFLTGWELVTLEDCELTMPERPDDGERTGANGQIVCAGVGQEHLCE